MAHSRTFASDSVLCKLSDREHQLLQGAIGGLTDQGIASKLGISLPTVATYWGRIRSKLGLHNRAELVAIYLSAQSIEDVNSLKLKNQTLEEERTKHAQVVEALQHQIDFFRAIIQSAPDAILLIDEAGIIRLANEPADRLFGYETGDLEGMNVDLLVPQRFRDTHAAHRSEFAANPMRRSIGSGADISACCKDGSEILIDAALGPIRMESGLLVTVIIRETKPTPINEPSLVDDKSDSSRH